MQYDSVPANEADSADVTVEVDPYAWPVETCGNLLQVTRLTGTMQPLQHDPPVVGETRENSEGRISVETVSVIDVWHMLAALAEGGHLPVRIHTEMLAHRDLNIRLLQWVSEVSVSASDLCHGSVSSVDLEGERPGSHDSSSKGVEQYRT